MIKKIYILVVIVLNSISGFSQIPSKEYNLPSYSFRKLNTDKGLSSDNINCIYQDRKGYMWIGTNGGLNRFDGNTAINFSGSKKLSSYLISDICEDENNNLWIGTKEDGLIRYNQVTETFKKYRHEPLHDGSISSNYVSKCQVDEVNQLWVITNKQLNVLDLNRTSDQQSVREYDFHSEKTLRAKLLRILPIAPGVCYATSVHGIFLLKFNQAVDSSKGIEIERISNKSTFCIARENHKRVWGNSENKLFLFQYDSITNNHSFTFYSTIINGQNANLGRISSIVFDKSDRIWIGTSKNGLFSGRIDNYKRKVFIESHSFFDNSNASSLSNNMIRCLYIDSGNVLWIGTEGGGINILDTEAKPFSILNSFPGKLNSKICKAVYEDKSYNTWVAIDGSGVYFLPDINKPNITKIEKVDFLDSTLNEIIRSVQLIYQTNDSVIWFGTEGRGLFSFTYEYNKKTGKLICSVHSFPRYNNLILDAPAITTILEDVDSKLWIGTYDKGLICASRNTKGLIDKKESVFTNIENDLSSISDNIIRHVIKTREGIIWVGTGKGLNKLEKNKNKIFFKKYFAGDQTGDLNKDYILPIFESSKGDLWIGTLGGGLSKYSTDVNGVESFINYTTKNGLPNNIVKAIQEDKVGNIWVSTNKGISKFNPTKELFINYTVEDGLQGNSFNELATIKSNSGFLVFGGVNGISIFNPEDIKTNPWQGNIVLTNLKVLDKTILPGQQINGRILLEKAIAYTNEITLLHREKKITFEVSNLDYTSHSTDYQYILHGFDNEWNRLFAPDHTIKYTSLPPGKYILEINTTEQDFNSKSTLKINVKPPFWLTWIAFIIYTLVFAFLVYIFSRFSIIRNKRKSELLMERFEKEKIAELASMKLNFFTQISHEFRTPLTIIVGTIEKLFDKNPEFQKDYNIVRRTTNTLLRLITQLSNFQKHEQGLLKLQVSNNNIVQFCQKVFESFKNIAEGKELDFCFKPSVGKVMLWFDTDKLEKILFNLISNAIKYTQKQGKVELVLSDIGERVEIQIKDSGIGIAKEQHKNLFNMFYRANSNENMGTGIGLTFSKSLVEMHGGELYFESEVGKGSTFYLVLKKGNEHYNQEDIIESDHQAEILENLSQSREWKEPVNVIAEEPQAELDRSSFWSVLVVDDDIQIRDFIKNSLEESYKVIVAANGREGYEKALENIPDLVISDIMMPEKDGFELCQDLKSNSKTSHIPIILLTARSNDNDQLRGFGLEADAYVLKPFNVEVLKARIDGVIKTRRRIINQSTTQISLEPEQITISKVDELFLKRAVKVLEKNISNPEYSVSNFASDLGISSPHLNNKFKKLLNQTTIKFMRSVRMKRAIQLLKLGTSVTDTAYETGHNSVRRFRDSFKEFYDVAPSAFYKGKD